MIEMKDRSQHPTMDASTPNNGNDLSNLRAARDAALLAAQAAVRDTISLTRLLTILSDPIPLPQMLEQVLSTLSELFSADIVVLLDPVCRGTYLPLATVGIPEDLIEKSFTNVEGSYTVSTLESRRPILVENVDKDEKVDQQLRDLGVKTGIWLPVTDNNSARGVLILARCKPIAFQRTDIGLLSAMTHRIGLSIEQAQRSIQLENTVHIGGEINSKLDENCVCTKAVSMFPAIIGAEAAVLFLKNIYGKPEWIAESNFPPEWEPGWTSLTEHLISDIRLNYIRPYNTHDLHRIIDQFKIEIPHDCNVRAHLAVPIQYEGQVQGILYGMRFSTSTFNPDTVQIAMLYAGQTSAAIENARLYRAVHDELSIRKRVERALRASDERFRALIRSVSDVISILSAEGKFLYVSPAAEIAWGCPVDVLLTLNFFDRISEDDHDRIKDLFSTLLAQSNNTIMSSLRLRYGEDNWRDVEIVFTNLLDDSAVGGIVTICHDVTERKTYEQELRKLALRDPLTGLSNRVHFRERLTQALDHANKNNQSVAVIFFDLDNFKDVNDSLGHVYGDQVLCVVADRIRGCLRRDDVAARLGGDEFTILVDPVTGFDQLMPLTHRLLNSLNDPISTDEVDLLIGASLGITISIPNEDSADDLLRKADLAMYDAKSKGKGHFSIYDNKMNASAVKRLKFKTDIQHAVERDEFRIYYQPIYSLNDRQIFAVEAFVRWQHPQQGLIVASEFIGLAEETGVIIQIGDWIMNEACKQFHFWQQRYQGVAPVLLNINLSARQLRNSPLENEIVTLLNNYHLDPSYLMIDISERTFAEDTETTIERLKVLKDIGIKIAIDDFGSGTTNLNFLKTLPIDLLKIDLSMIKGMQKDPRNTAIVEGIVFSALSMGLSVIAEGVETQKQVELLQSIGCNNGQGYFFSPALTTREFSRLLEKGQ